jgi:Fanconi anemia group M protein
MPFLDIFSGKKLKPQEKITIIADHREKNSLVFSELVSLGIELDIKHLPVADFLINNIAIERKTVSDFISSMINKRLIRQLEEMKQYPQQLLLIEGIEEQELYQDSNEGINPNAIRGFLLSILLKFQVPIIYTKNSQDTAKFLYILAKKKENPEPAIRAKKKSLNKKEQLQFILEGFPNIGPTTAKKLLKKYKTLKNIFNLSQEELKKDIGKKSEIFKLVESEY